MLNVRSLWVLPEKICYDLKMLSIKQHIYTVDNSKSLRLRWEDIKMPLMSSVKELMTLRCRNAWDNDRFRHFHCTLVFIRDPRGSSCFKLVVQQFISVIKSALIIYVNCARAWMTPLVGFVSTHPNFLQSDRRIVQFLDCRSRLSSCFQALCPPLVFRSF